MDKKTAILASLFLALMPANIHYSTWIKQDAMLLFFFLWGLYFYLMESYLKAGILIGLALLVKEFALFFFPISFFIAAIAERKEDRYKVWYGWLKTLLIALLLSFWWYILFGSSIYRVTSEAIIGGNIKEVMWHYPWWFYAKNIPYDLSYPLFFLLLIGTMLLLKEILQYRIIGKQIVLFAWLLVLYLPLSFVLVKAPWYMYLATPPMAIIAAYGLIKIVELFKRVIFRRLLYVMVYSFLAYSICTFDNIKYFEGITGFSRPFIAKEGQGKSWEEMLEKKKIWEEKIKDSDIVGFLEFHPILQYLMGISKERVVVLGAGNFMTLDREGLQKLAIEHKLKYLILNKHTLTYTDRNLSDMRYLWGEPIVIGGFIVFSTCGENC